MLQLILHEELHHRAVKSTIIKALLHLIKRAVHHLKQFRTISKAVELTRKKIDLAPDYLNLKRTHELLDQAEDALEKMEVENASTLVKKAKFSVKKIANQYVKIKTGLSLSRSKLDSLARAGTDVSHAEVLYSTTEKHLEEGNYEKAMGSIKECIDECVKKLESSDG